MNCCLQLSLSEDKQSEWDTAQAQKVKAGLSPWWLPAPCKGGHECGGQQWEAESCHSWEMTPQPQPHLMLVTKKRVRAKLVAVMQTSLLFLMQM